MNWNKLGEIILLIVSIPLIIGIIHYALTVSFASPEEHMNQSTELIVQAATPWWIGIVEWLSNMGEIGALAIIGLLIVLKKMKIL